jgi:hypothetical protein
MSRISRRLGEESAPMQAGRDFSRFLQEQIFYFDESQASSWRK